MRNKKEPKVFDAVRPYVDVDLNKIYEPQLFWITLALKFNLDKRALEIIGSTYSGFEIIDNRLIMPASVYYNRSRKK